MALLRQRDFAARPAATKELGVAFPHEGGTHGSLPWVSSSQHNIVRHQGRPHHVVVIADADTRVVNPRGNHSMRGGTLAQKCYNPDNRTRERLTTPLLRVKGQLQPVSWDTALTIMAAVSKHVLTRHGEHAWGVKAYSYQYFENTYAITKLAFDAIGTPAYAPHDKCANSNDAAGLDDAGLEAFAPAYQDWGACDVLYLSGTDPLGPSTPVRTLHPWRRDVHLSRGRSQLRTINGSY